MTPENVRKYIDQLSEIIPADIDRMFDVILNLTKDLNDAPDSGPHR